MCGRFNFSAEEAEEIKQIIQEVNDKLYGQQIKTGEIRPTNLVPVLVPGKEDGEAAAMRWGFPRAWKAGVDINAKAETIMDPRKTYWNKVVDQRCVIVSSGFFEWSHDENQKTKTKYLFKRPGENVLYMAGFWKQVQEKDGSEGRRFVILTTQANDSMKEDTGELSLFPDEAGTDKLIHDRMPIVLSADERREWLSDHADFERIFNREHVLLEKQAV